MDKINAVCLVILILAIIFCAAVMIRDHSEPEVEPTPIPSYTVEPPRTPKPGMLREVVIDESSDIPKQTIPPTPEKAPEPVQEMVYLGEYRITGYDLCMDCCGKTDGITASGTQASVGRTCAAGSGLPFGTRIFILTESVSALWRTEEGP